MHWHDRYLFQAGWTSELRSYLFEKVHLSDAHRVLEVGCGTGAILRDLSITSPFGVDIEPAVLRECQQVVPSALLTCGNALALPYCDNAFTITYCHFLLMWVRDPLKALQEMKRVTAHSGYVLALAEPDYNNRVDLPAGLAQLGAWQSAALRGKGVAVDLGSRLSNLFQESGISILESGALRSRQAGTFTAADHHSEWQVLEADLAGTVPPSEMENLKRLDEEAWVRGERVLHVPTYFAWGQV